MTADATIAMIAKLLTLAIKQTELRDYYNAGAHVGLARTMVASLPGDMQQRADLLVRHVSDHCFTQQTLDLHTF